MRRSSVYVEKSLQKFERFSGFPRIKKKTDDSEGFRPVNSFTIHVELKEATADDYVRLNAAMTHQGFASVNNQPVQEADFTYAADLPLEAVLYMVRFAATETRKHFSISVNEVGGKGVGMAG